MNKFNKLLTILPANKVLLTDEAVRPYECDGLPAYKQRPGAVVLPDSVDEIKTILKYCHEQQIPIIPRGAGTGLSGGALPREDGVLLSLAKFQKIINIDPQARTATLQPGVRNLAISQAAAIHNLYYAPDPSSQIACTIGGNIAENSGGVHCLKYGLTTHNILQLKVLTIDGELLTIGSEALDSSGYDLLALLTGSEGLLGIIIEITVKLLIKPPHVKVLLASFDDVGLAGKAVADIIASGIIPAGLEMMDNAALCAAEDFVKVGYPKGAAAILLCELDGTENEVNLQVQRTQVLLKQSGATDIRIAETEQEKAQFWAGRKNAFPAVGRISPDYYCMDGTIPRKHLPEVLQGIAQLSQHYNLPVVNVFHAGDGNLHPLILYDANQTGELEKAEELGGRILELSVAYGGSITGEHGVGIEKINQMCVQFNADELTQFHAIKQAFDPLKLLNPGKAIPTLHRCAEFGALHVHHGELPFPELERF
jgi:glycolate oxidase